MSKIRKRQERLAVHFKKLTAVLLVLALILTTISSMSISSVYASDMTDSESAQIVKDRIKATFLESDSYRVVSGSDIFGYISKSMEYANTIQPNGSWSDVNYADRTNSANGTLWSPYLALYRITAMAMGYNQEGNEAYHNPVIKDAIERALAYWDSAKPSSTNWWENEIGQAMCMGVTGIFMEGIISKQALDVCINYNQGRLDTVGANGVWRTQDYLYKKLVQNDYPEVVKGISTLAETLAVDEKGTSNEAVQADSSFYCHGAKLYSEGYGMAQFNMVAMWVGYTSGTNFAFTEEALKKLEFYILDGTRWMIRGEFGFLYLGYRRYNTIEGVSSYAADILPGMIIMAQYDTDPERRAKYQQVVDNIEGKSATNGLVGNKHFWRSDYTSQMRDNYGIMTKMSSSRINGGEYRSTFRSSIGNEIYWNAAGTTAIFVNGHEYTDLVPAFNWSHYPGTTAPNEKMPYTLECKFNANSSFVGGVSDGMYGASVFTQDMDSTVARKGYFYFDDEMVALGAGISSTRPVEVHTTVNQAIAKDNASVDGVLLPKGTAAVTYTNPKWAYNDQIGYVFPADSKVSISNMDQTSNWLDHPAQTKQAFTLYFNHGINPANASYEYIVVPGKDSAEVEAYSNNIPVQILSNTTELQAVRNEGLNQTQLIFYTPGSFEYRTGATITVNQPCLAIIDESSGTPKVTVSNPETPGLIVDVKITETDKDTLYGRYNLGSGIYMGQSITQTLSDVPLSASNIGASSFLPGYAPLNAIDDSMDTSWRSEPDESQYIVYNIDTPIPLVDKVTVDWGTDYAKEYIVQYSTDNVNWTDGYLQWHGSGGKEVIDLPYVQAKYIRILMLSSNKKNGYDIKDLNVHYNVNLALYKPSSTSGNDAGSMATYANDGNDTTRWSGPTTAANAWWQVNLGAKSKVRTIRISWESSYSTSFKIQTSDDGGTWTDVNTFTNDKPGVQILNFPEGSIDARYIRLQSITKVNTYGISMYEFEVFGEADVPAPLPNYGGRQNLAYGKTVTVDSSWSGSANIESPYATTVPTDGNMGTRASTGRGTAEVTQRSFYVDLGQPLSINEIKLFWEVNSQHVYLEYSNDPAGPWTPITSINRSTYKGNEQDDVKFKPITARYIRVKGVMATKYGLAIYEFEVYGDYSYKLDNHAVTLNKGDTLDLKAILAPYSETDSADFKSYNTDAVTVGTPAVSGDSVPGEQGTYTARLEAVSGGTSVIIVRHSAGSEYDLCTVKVNTFKNDLQALYDIASQLDQNDYISSSWTDSDIDSVLVNANTVLGDNNSTQRQVDAAIQNLQTAMNILEKRSNKASLVTAMSQVNALKQADYTPESWESANLEKLLADANSVYFNDYATQQEIDFVVNALIAAMNGLVKVTNPENPDVITLDSTSKSVYRGQEFTITATVTSPAAIDSIVLFSSDSDAVIVGETESSTPGGITIVHLSAAKVGNAIITATTSGGGIARCAVNVLAAGVVLDTPSKTLYPGDSFTLTATAVPEEAVNKEISFSVGNSIVSLGTPSYDAQNGITTVQVTAIRTGTTIITATTADGGTAQCVVTVQPYIDDSRSGGGNGGGSGSSSSTSTNTTPPPAASNNTISDAVASGHGSVTSTIAAAAKTDKDGKATAAVTEKEVTEAINKVIEAAAKMDKGTAANVEIKVSAPSGAKAVEVSLPKEAVDKVVSSKIDTMTISTPIAVMTFDKESVKTISQSAAGDVKITASSVDSTTLSDEAKRIAGGRPVVDLSVTSGGKTISEFAGNVTVSIPYTAKAGEDTEAVVIYCINSQGSLELVSSCVYNKETEMISFKSDNLSKYSVGYNKIGFKDVAEGAWYSKAVSFIAARGITTGTGNGSFSPDAELTRGQFLTMVMKAYEIKADENATDNFTDAGNKFYTGYLAAAKRLGISDGVGNNKFAPDKEITREEMFTLLYNILKLRGELPAGNSGKDLKEFSDTKDIAAWAKPAMSIFTEAGIIAGNLGRLSPKDTTNRAQMAQVLYNLIKNQMQ